MSWSVILVGTPLGVAKELDAYGETLTEQSQSEFLEAKPYLQGLIGQVVGQNVKLSASGHATFTKEHDKTYGNVSVSIECFYGKWCE